MTDDSISDALTVTAAAADPDPWDASAAASATAMPAEWSTPAFQREAEAIFARYPRRINALLSILQLAAAHAPLTPETLPHLARLCWTTTDVALRVARAYHLVSAGAPVPTLWFCVNVHCQVNGAEALRDACRAVLHGRAVQMKDYVCFGYCEVGPCVEIEGRLVTEATAAKVVAALDREPAKVEGGV
jgi:NADH:ubiquinone oxidoreductase subunit E